MITPSRPRSPLQGVLDFPRLIALVATLVLHLLALMFLTYASRPRLSATPSNETVTRLVWVKSSPVAPPMSPPVEAPLSPLATLPEPSPDLPIIDAGLMQEPGQPVVPPESADVASQSEAPPELPQGVVPLVNPPLPYSGTETLLPIMVGIMIDPGGGIKSVSIAQSSGSEQWDAAALEHVRSQWKFQGYGVTRLATFPVELTPVERGNE